MNAMSIDIETAAGKAKRLKAGNEEKENRSIDELIKADQYLSAQTSQATGNKRRGLIISKLRPPGSI